MWNRAKNNLPTKCTSANVSTSIFIWILTNSWGEGSLCLSLWRYVIQIELLSFWRNFCEIKCEARLSRIKKNQSGFFSHSISIRLLIQRILNLFSRPPFRSIQSSCRVLPPGTSSFNPRKWKSFPATTEKQHRIHEEKMYILWYQNDTMFYGIVILANLCLFPCCGRMWQKGGMEIGNFKSFPGEIVLNFLWTRVG